MKPAHVIRQGSCMSSPRPERWRHPSVLGAAGSSQSHGHGGSRDVSGWKLTSSRSENVTTGETSPPRRHQPGPATAGCGSGSRPQD